MVRKTKPEDFPKVVPLLEEFDNGSIKRSDWQRIFACDWSKDESIVGFHLEHQGKVEIKIIERKFVCRGV